MAGEQTTTTGPGGTRREGGGASSGEDKVSIGGRVQAVVDRLDKAADEHRANLGSKEQRGDARRARLRLTRIDPWSVMKMTFLLSIAVGVVAFVAVAVVWAVLSAAGLFESINQIVRTMLGSEAASGFDVEDYFGMSRILGITVVIAALDVVLVTVLATLGAFLYNLAAALLGGVDVTLVEDR